MITTQEAIKLSKDKPADEKKAEEQAAFAEARLAKLQWLEHPVTKSLIRTLRKLDMDEVSAALAHKHANRDQQALNSLVALEQLRFIKDVISSPDIIFGNAHTTNNNQE
jgi:hypothetical protein